MSSVVISGDTSGSVSVTVPAVAGSNTITLPAATGTVLTSVSPASDLPSSIKGPAFSAYGNAGQTIATATWTKVAYNTVGFDTSSPVAYDTVNYRFLPKVAGYYQFNAAIGSGVAPASGLLSVGIYKNGSLAVIGNSISFASSGPDAAVSGMVYLNGSTDYVEIYMRQTSGSTASFGSYTPVYAFSGALVRAA